MATEKSKKQNENNISCPLFFCQKKMPKKLVMSRIPLFLLWSHTQQQSNALLGDKFWLHIQELLLAVIKKLGNEPNPPCTKNVFSPQSILSRQFNSTFIPQQSSGIKYKAKETYETKEKLFSEPLERGAYQQRK